jgi:hypothetical protein
MPSPADRHPLLPCARVTDVRSAAASEWGSISKIVPTTGNQNINYDPIRGLAGFRFFEGDRGAYALVTSVL